MGKDTQAEYISDSNPVIFKRAGSPLAEGFLIENKYYQMNLPTGKKGRFNVAYMLYVGREYPDQNFGLYIFQDVLRGTVVKRLNKKDLNAIHIQGLTEAEVQKLTSNDTQEPLLDVDFKPTSTSANDDAIANEPTSVEQESPAAVEHADQGAPKLDTNTQPSSATQESTQNTMGKSEKEKAFTPRAYLKRSPSDKEGLEDIYDFATDRYAQRFVKKYGSSFTRARDLLIHMDGKVKKQHAHVLIYLSMAKNHEFYMNRYADYLFEDGEKAPFTNTMECTKEALFGILALKYPREQHEIQRLNNAHVRRLLSDLFKIDYHTYKHLVPVQGNHEEDTMDASSEVSQKDQMVQAFKAHLPTKNKFYHYLADHAASVLTEDEYAIFANRYRPIQLRHPRSKQDLPQIILDHRTNMGDRVKDAGLYLVVAQKLLGSILAASEQGHAIGKKALPFLNRVIDSYNAKLDPAPQVEAKREIVTATPLPVREPTIVAAEPVSPSLGSQTKPGERNALMSVFDEEAKLVPPYSPEKGVLEFVRDHVTSPLALRVVSGIALRKNKGSFAELATETNQEEFVLEAVFERAVKTVRQRATEQGLDHIATFKFEPGQA